MTIKDLEETASVRVYNCLILGYGPDCDIEFLKTLSGGDLLKNRNFGLKSLAEISALLNFDWKI